MVYGGLYGGMYGVWCLLDCMDCMAFEPDGACEPYGALCMLHGIVHGAWCMVKCLDGPGGEGAAGGGVPARDHQAPHGHRGQGAGFLFSSNIFLKKTTVFGCVQCYGTTQNLG